MDAPSSTVAKAIRVLVGIRERESGASARELAGSIGLPRSTVQRLLTSLAESGMVMQNAETQRYAIGPQAMWIGLGHRHGSALVSIARRHMLALRDETGETVGLSITVGDARMFIEEFPSTSELRFASELGRRYPLWSGAAGRALMSSLSESEVEQILAAHDHEDAMFAPLDLTRTRELIADAARDGYATATSESLANVNSVAVPVRDARGQVVAALSVSGPADRFTADRMTEAAPALAGAAETMNRSLRGGIAIG